MYCEMARFTFPDSKTRRNLVYKYCCHNGKAGDKTCAQSSRYSIFIMTKNTHLKEAVMSIAQTTAKAKNKSVDKNEEKGFSTA